MCENCKKLQQELDSLRSEWDSAEATYSRFIELFQKKYHSNKAVIIAYDLSPDEFLRNMGFE